MRPNQETQEKHISDCCHTTFKQILTNAKKAENVFLPKKIHAQLKSAYIQLCGIFNIPLPKKLCQQKTALPPRKVKCRLFLIHW